MGMYNKTLNHRGGPMTFTVYLAGEIHSDWRKELIDKTEERKLPFIFVSPQTDHDASDSIGEEILGEQPNDLYKDDKASDINNFRTQLLMAKADLVIARFGDKYSQWNTAMDATIAIEKKKPLILIRPHEKSHALKELSNRANVTVETLDQAIQILEYIFK